jgi:hypothetical protein
MDIDYSALYIELDCLLDTRISTLLLSFGPEAVKTTLAQGYHTRWVDKFPNISYDDFQAAYAQRDKRTIQQAIKTPLTKLIQEFVLGTNANTANTPFHHNPKIIINIHPYKLTQNEIRVVRDVVVALTKGQADIEMVSLSLEEITPRYVNNEISLLVMYDYHLWLETHSANDNFKKAACPQIGLFAPMMFKKYPVTTEDKKIIQSLDTPVFDHIARTISPFIRAVFLPAENFSLAVNPYKKP